MGIINPNEGVLCKVILRPTTTEIINAIIPCWISSETENVEQMETEVHKTLARSNSVRRKAALDTGKKVKNDDKKNSLLNSHILFVRVRATVEAEEVFRSEPNVLANKHIDLSPALDIAEEPLENITKEEHAIASEIVSQMLAEIIRHPDVKEAMKLDANLPSPLFAQLVPCNSHRLTSALPPKLKEDKDLFSTVEFQEFTESVMEETLHALMAEASSGAFDLFTAPHGVTEVNDEQGGEKRVKFGQFV
jgi:hypothetical protein